MKGGCVLCSALICPALPCSALLCPALRAEEGMRVLRKVRVREREEVWPPPRWVYLDLGPYLAPQ
jgi:hypothetical protein